MQSLMKRQDEPVSCVQPSVGIQFVNSWLSIFVASDLLVHPMLSKTTVLYGVVQVAIILPS